MKHLDRAARTHTSNMYKALYRDEKAARAMNWRSMYRMLLSLRREIGTKRTVELLRKMSSHFRLLAFVLEGEGGYWEIEYDELELEDGRNRDAIVSITKWKHEKVKKGLDREQEKLEVEIAKSKKRRKKLDWESVTAMLLGLRETIGLIGVATIIAELAADIQDSSRAQSKR